MNHAHLRLVKPANSTQTSPVRPARSVEKGMISEEDVDALMTDPAEVLARELGRTVKRFGPLPPELAARMVQDVARAVADGYAAGRYIDSGSHVYWLGAILFYAITGQAPLAPRPGATRPQDACPSLSMMATHPVDPAIEALIQKCMAPKRSDRFASVAQICEAFAALSLGHSEEDDMLEGSFDDLSLDASDRPSHVQLRSIPPISSYAQREWEEALDHAI